MEISTIGRKLWNLSAEEIKSIKTVAKFKIKIIIWDLIWHLYQLSKKFIPNLGYKEL